MQWDDSMSASEVSTYLALPPQVVNERAFKMHLMAHMFVKDAVSLGRRTSPGQFVLFIHGIELALKAYLHEKGLTLQELNDLRHDLNALLARAEALGLKVTASETASVLDRLNKANTRAALRYEFGFTVPMQEEIQHIANALLEATKEARRT